MDLDADATYGEFPLKHHLGMEVAGGSSQGTATARLDAGESHLNPNGVVHGAVLFALVDTAMGKAAMSVLDVGQFCTSVEVHLRFIRPVYPGQVDAVSSVVRRGKRIVHLDAEVRDGGGELVTTATGTFAVITP